MESCLSCGIVLKEFHHHHSRLICVSHHARLDLTGAKCFFRVVWAVDGQSVCGGGSPLCGREASSKHSDCNSASSFILQDRHCYYIVIRYWVTPRSFVDRSKRKNNVALESICMNLSKHASKVVSFETYARHGSSIDNLINVHVRNVEFEKGRLIRHFPADAANTLHTVQHYPPCPIQTPHSPVCVASGMHAVVVVASLVDM